MRSRSSRRVCCSKRSWRCPAGSRRASAPLLCSQARGANGVGMVGGGHGRGWPPRWKPKRKGRGSPPAPHNSPHSCNHLPAVNFFPLSVGSGCHPPKPRGETKCSWMKSPMQSGRNLLSTLHTAEGSELLSHIVAAMVLKDKNLFACIKCLDSAGLGKFQTGGCGAWTRLLHYQFQASDLQGHVFTTIAIMIQQLYVS